MEAAIMGIGCRVKGSRVINMAVDQNSCSHHGHSGE